MSPLEMTPVPLESGSPAAPSPACPSRADVAEAGIGWPFASTQTESLRHTAPATTAQSASTSQLSQLVLELVCAPPWQPAPKLNARAEAHKARTVKLRRWSEFFIFANVLSDVETSRCSERD
jgi:hypothetical protein